MERARERGREPRSDRAVCGDFEQYWQEPEFETMRPSVTASGSTTRSRDSAADTGKDNGLLLSCWSTLHRNLTRLVALEALEAERLRGYHRNLVVAATGTGKTWIAAFDFKRLRDQGAAHSMLFVAHRDEILLQSQQVFQLVLRDPEFGERLVGGERPRAGRHVFASVQSLANRIDEIDSGRFRRVHRG